MGSVGGMHISSIGSLVAHAGWRAVVVAIVVALVGPMLGPLGVMPAAPLAAASPAAHRAYVANSAGSTVWVIDTATKARIATITVGPGPFGIALTPDGRYAYTANYDADSVSVIDTTTNTVTNTITVGDGPYGIAITPDGTKAYVPNSGANTVSVISTATKAVTATVTGVGYMPQSVAVTPDGSAVWVGNYGDGSSGATATANASSLTKISTATNAVVWNKPNTGRGAVGIAMSPDGSYAFIAQYDNDRIARYSLATETYVGGPSGAIAPWVAVDHSPIAVAVSPAGDLGLAVTKDANELTTFTVADFAHAGRTTIEGPTAVAVMPDGRTAYVGSQGASGSVVLPVDLTAYPRAIGSGISGFAGAIAFTPDQAPVAQLSVGIARTGIPTTFDASASTVAYGTIASYAWDFGDGTTATTTTPTTTHTYASPGTFSASVTETSSAGTSTTKVFTGQTMSRNGGPQARAQASVTVAAPPRPAVTGVSPTSGTRAGGTPVTITGSGFWGASEVRFGAAAATGVSVVSDTEVRATSPAGTGTVHVTVTTPGGASTTSAADQFTYLLPSVTGVSPATGHGAGGTAVTITGSLLTGTTSVRFGTTAATNVHVVSDTQVTAVAPPGTGTVHVTATTAGGTSATSSADQFTYITPVMSGVSPASGPAAGGTTVTISGSDLTGATAVRFGTSAATGVTVLSDTQVRAVAPAGLGTAHVTVTTPDGTSPATAADEFTYLGPTGSGVLPVSGPGGGGTTVTITGSALTGATAVHFGTATATGVTVVSDTEVRAASPAGSGTVDVTVTTPGGTSTAGQFTYLVPTVTGISPTSGPGGSGLTVTITGSALTGTSAVHFGTASATGIHVVSDTEVTAVAPAGAGTVYVTVTTPAGTSLAVGAAQFTYLVPTVSAIAPVSGPGGGGTTVTITGSALTGTSSVRFGTAAATGVTVVSDTQVTAVAPSGSGTVDVTVTSPAGTSTPVTSARFAYLVPTVTAVSPGSGSGAWGVPVTITGTSLTGTSAVHFGSVLGTGVRVISDTQVTAVAPGGTGTVDVTVTTPAGTSETNADARFTYLVVPAAWVVNAGGNSVTPIDLTTNTPGAPIAVGTRPADIAITPDGSTAYVLNQGNGGAGSVTPIDLTTTPVTLGTPVSVAIQPIAIAIAPDGRTAYVVDYGSYPGTVTPIDLTTTPATRGTPIAVGDTATALAITPDGSAVLVANAADGTVSRISTATNTVTETIRVGEQYWAWVDAVAITPDGTTAYVADASTYTVTPVDLTTTPATPGTPIAVGQNPDDIAIASDGTTAYVANYDSGTLTPITVATNIPGDPISMGVWPTSLVLSADGRTAYAASYDAQKLAIVDLVTGSKTIVAVGPYPTAVAIVQGAKAVQAITFTVPTDVVYGDEDRALGATASSGLTVGYTSSTSSICTIVEGRLHVLSAGDCTITAAQAGNSIWNAASPVDRTFTIAKAALTVTAQDRTITYGQATPTFAVAYDGFIGPDTAAALGGTVAYEFAGIAPTVYESSPTPPVHAGTYSITPSGLTSTNYAITFVPGTYTISPISISTMLSWAGSITPSPAVVGQQVSFPGVLARSLGPTISDTALTVTLRSWDNAGCSGGFIDRDTQHIDASGSVTLHFTPGAAGSYRFTLVFTGRTSGDSYYASASSTCNSITVNPVKLDQTITFLAPVGVTYGDADVSLGATATSGLAVSYASTTSSVCTIADGKLHVVAAGDCTVTASQAGNSTWNAATPVSRTFAIAKALLTVTAQEQTITYGQTTPTFGVTYAGFVNGDVATDLGGTLVYTFAGVGGTTYAASTTPPTWVGHYSITPSGLTSGDYAITFVAGEYLINPVRVETVLAWSGSVTPNPAPAGQAITFPGALTETGSGTAIGVTSLQIQLREATNTSCELPGSTRRDFGTIDATGHVTLHWTPGVADIGTHHLLLVLYQDTVGATNYTEATSTCVSVTVIAAMVDQTIEFDAPTGVAYGDTDLVLGATADSGLPVSYASSTTGVCTIVDDKLHVVAAGECTITASQAGDATHNPAPDVPQSFTIGKATQSISFGTLAGKTYQDAQFAVTASATSGLPVTFTASGSCTVDDDGDPVTITGAGSCTITAAQAGNANWKPAPDVPQTFAIAKADQSITFDAPSGITFTTPDFDPGATATSTLPVTYASSTPAVCTIEAGKLHVAGVGECAVTASQPGDDDWNAARNVTHRFTIGKANQDITFGSLPDRTFGDGPLTVTASAGSGLPVTFAATGSCTVDTDGNPLAITGAGSCTITASQAGDANWNAATPVDQTFPIAKATATAVYTGTTYRLLTSGSTTSVALTADVSPAVCAGDLAFKVTAIGGDVVSTGAGTVTLPIGLYWVEVTVAGENCTGGHDQATISIVSAGDKSNGGGWYKVDAIRTGSPRVNFGYTVQSSSTKDKKTGIVTTTYRGQLLWLNNEQWRLKGSMTGETTTINAETTGTAPYGTFICPTALTSALPASSSGYGCGSVTGRGVLQLWDASALAWVESSYGTVTFTATMYDGGQAKVCKTTGKKTTCTSVENPDWFGIEFESVPSAEVRESQPVQVSGGSLKVGS